MQHRLFVPTFIFIVVVRFKLCSAYTIFNDAMRLHRRYEDAGHCLLRQTKRYSENRVRPFENLYADAFININIGRYLTMYFLLRVKTLPTI